MKKPNKTARVANSVFGILLGMILTNLSQKQYLQTDLLLWKIILMAGLFISGFSIASYLLSFITPMNKRKYITSFIMGSGLILGYSTGNELSIIILSTIIAGIYAMFPYIKTKLNK